MNQRLDADDILSQLGNVFGSEARRCGVFGQGHLTPTGQGDSAVIPGMANLGFKLVWQFGRYAANAVFSPKPDPFNEYGDAEQRRQAMVHSFEILQAREGGFDQAAFLENALEMVTSIWTAVGTGAFGSIRPLLTPWCSGQWEQAAPRFVPVHPPSLAIEHLSLDQAIPGDDVDLVEVSIWTPEGQPPQGFPKVWAFARPRAPGNDATPWKLESVRLYERTALV